MQKINLTKRCKLKRDKGFHKHYSFQAFNHERVLTFQGFPKEKYTMMTAPQEPAKSMGTPIHSNVRQITNAIIRRAMKEHSSDIHIIPLAEHSTIRFRIEGELSEPIRIPISLHEQVISFFRHLAEQRYSPMSEMQLDQTLRRFEVRVGALAYEMEIDERPSSHGEYIVLHCCINKV